MALDVDALKRLAPPPRRVPWSLYVHLIARVFTDAGRETFSLIGLVWGTIGVLLQAVTFVLRQNAFPSLARMAATAFALAFPLYLLSMVGLLFLLLWQLPGSLRFMVRSLGLLATGFPAFTSSGGGAGPLADVPADKRNPMLILCESENPRADRGTRRLYLFDLGGVATIDEAGEWRVNAGVVRAPVAAAALIAAWGGVLGVGLWNLFGR